MLLDNYQEFIDLVLLHIEKSGVDISEAPMDHIAYQASTDEDYDTQKIELLKISREMKEDIVGGRRVGIFELNTPIAHKGYEIPVVEIVAPKEGHEPESRLYHFELVIKTPLHDFVKQYPKINWNTSAIDRDPYNHLTLEFEDGLAVKFHNRSITDIVNSL